ncbi:hypothetical protein GJ496_001400 [Pomphorhynchus laevis]|nr:hypothetical protein GJ496_001400 [Pomphorhynchus laevis]
MLVICLRKFTHCLFIAIGCGVKEDDINCLYDVLNNCKTRHGSRLLRSWMMNPLTSYEEIATEQISKELQRRLFQLLQKITVHISLTDDFLRRFEKIKIGLPASTLCEALDVTLLYTNISPFKGIEACISAMRNAGWEENEIKTPVELLKFVLNENMFEFDNILNKQTSGTSMRTTVVPVFVDPYMNTWLNRKYFKT